MQILKYLMDSCCCLVSGQGVCWKGQSLETLKQTVPQQLLKSMEIYLTSAEGGWKVLVIAVVVKSYFLPRLFPTLQFVGSAQGQTGFAQATRLVCGDAGTEVCTHRATLSQGCGPRCGDARGHKLPAAPTSLLVIQQEKTPGPSTRMRMEMLKFKWP